MTAVVGLGVRPGAQAEIVPSSVSKMKTAGMPLGFVIETVPGTTNAEDGFQMMPVGPAGVGIGAGAGGGLMVWQSVRGTTLPGRGIDTCSPIFKPVPSYSVEQPVALSAIQKGLPAGEKATPHEFCSTRSWKLALPAKSETSGVTT